MALKCVKTGVEISAHGQTRMKDFSVSADGSNHPSILFKVDFVVKKCK